MKSTMKKLFVILAIVMSFITVQSASAETIIEGTIETISTRPNLVVVNEDDGPVYNVYGVMFNYLVKKYDISLTVNQWVSFTVYEYECSDGTTKLKACKIKINVEDDWISLRECQ